MGWAHNTTVAPESGLLLRSVEVCQADPTSLVGGDDAGEWKLQPALLSEKSEFRLAFSHPPHLSYHAVLLFSERTSARKTASCDAASCDTASVE